MAIHINLRRYPGWLADKADQFPFAASQALNDTAYTLQKDLRQRGQSDLRFETRPRPAMGIEVSKSTKAMLVAEIFSNRPWLTHQVQGGTASPVSGITIGGAQYLLIPNPRVVRRRSKRFGGRRGFARGRGGAFFTIRSGGGLVMMLRFGPDAEDITPLGRLVPEADYANDFKWKEQSDRTVERVMGDNFEKRIAQALRSGR